MINTMYVIIPRVLVSPMRTPRGLGDLGRRAFFSGAWGAFMIIFRDFGRKLIVFGGFESPAKISKK